MTLDALVLVNGRAADLADVPYLDIADLRALVLRRVDAGERVCAFFATPGEEPGDTDLYAVLASDTENTLAAARATISGDTFPSLTPACPQVHLFERDIAEQTGLRPKGHPWLKPVRFSRVAVGRPDPWGREAASVPLVGDMPYYAVSGPEVHEVAVGPVHAGVIEPGHFRFQCHGEEVFHLEISLGYQHRGVERALLGGPDRRALHYAETAAGDTTVGHTMAYCRNLEALSGASELARAQSLRGVALELERLANHIGDLGALAGDVGFLPTASYCGRIRGDALNMTAVLCGNRFGRGMVVPGGVGFDVDAARVEELSRRLDALERDAASAINLLWDTPSVMARFEGTGTLTTDFCREMGLVGPAARAADVATDARVTQPFGIYNFFHIPLFTWSTGDVFARAYVRWMEVQHAITFIRGQLRSLPAGGIRRPLAALRPESIAVSLIEGWRGEICHVALTDRTGRFARYRIVDPSFHNWPGLAHALRNQQISDFPLCNKSFNLSYCGHDL